MKKTKGTEELRRKAEAKVASQLADVEACSGDLETKRLLHELQVHQVELEMQNEELRQVIAERDAILETYQERYDSAPAGYFNLDHVGIINEVNQTGSALLRVERSLLINNHLDAFISDETRPAFHDFLDKVFTNDTKKTCEVVFVKQDHSPLFVQIEAIVSETRKNCRAVVIDITERKRVQEEIAKGRAEFAAIFNSISDGVVFVDTQRLIVRTNPAFNEMFGYQLEEIAGQTTQRIYADPDSYLKQGQSRFKPDAKITQPVFENEYRRKDGTTFPGETNGVHVVDETGQLLGYIGVIHDITERKKTEEELIKSQQLLSEMGKISEVGGWEFNVDTEFLQWTEEVYRIHEVGLDYVPTVENALDFYSDASKTAIAEAVQRAIKHDESFDLELEIITAKGALRHVHAIGTADPEHRRVNGIFQDITERKNTVEALRESEERFRTLSTATFEGILITRGGKIIDANKQFEEISGYSCKELIDRNIFDIVLPEHVDLVKKNIATEYALPYEIIAIKKNKEQIILEVRGRNLSYRSNNIRVSAIRDITRKKQIEKELEALASTDTLTGLANRRSGILFLEKQIRLSRRKSLTLTVCFIDVDGLKAVNDIFGHESGDYLIKVSGTILSNTLRDSDLVCRLGGDEFLAIFPDCNIKQASELWDRISAEIERINSTTDNAFQVSFSHGFSEFSPSSDLSADELISLADGEMYKEKKLKGG